MSFDKALMLPHVIVIGGGASGLMMADILSATKVASVSIYDAMPSLGRKFLQAGKGGLNLTHSEDFEAFLNRYMARSNDLRHVLQGFNANQVVSWAKGLGVETFVGSSGRVFPKDMKAAPLLRAWLHRLREQQVAIKVHHRWTGWSADGELVFRHKDQEVIVKSDAVVLALGGASWPHLGSDGQWVDLLQRKSITVAPLLPSNCGFKIDWPQWFQERYAGEPLKSIVMKVNEINAKGDCIISKDGIEGGVVYALSAQIRDQYLLTDKASLFIDLLPDVSVDQTQQLLKKPFGSKSVSQVFKQRLSLTGVKFALLKAILPNHAWQNIELLTSFIHNLPISIAGIRPIEEAISTAGGIRLEEMDQYFMLSKMPGVFAVGEMLDWEAPTGGYLLTMSMATAVQSANGVQRWLKEAGKQRETKPN